MEKKKLIHLPTFWDKDFTIRLSLSKILKPPLKTRTATRNFPHHRFILSAVSLTQLKLITGLRPKFIMISFVKFMQNIIPRELNIYQRV